MIRYALKCSADHSFESWFANADAFDSLKSGGMVACPECGVTDVSKSLMSPGVQPARAKAAATPPAAPASAELPVPAEPAQVDPRLVAMRKHVEANSEYVGMKFATEARKMHEGEAPHRAIYGEAKLEEAKKLLEDGIPVAPLPFTPTRKTN